MSTESTVYFLGAGASADAGVPLTDDLLRGIVRRIKAREERRTLLRFIDTFGFLRVRSIDLRSLMSSACWIRAFGIIAPLIAFLQLTGSGWCGNS